MQRAYWAELQNRVRAGCEVGRRGAGLVGESLPPRVLAAASLSHPQLPLPLAHLMEDEALQILTKSLQSYRKGIGKDHKLTQQLQRHVEKLRRNQKYRQFT
ncbi:cation channel sperm-associated auxiliary subunit zeta [Sarcophilus harrisii]